MEHPTAMQGMESSPDSLLIELNAVKYELAAIKQERDLEKLAYEQEIRSLQRKVQEDGKAFEQERNEKNFIFERHQNIALELESSRQSSIDEKVDLENRLRDIQSERDSIKETFQDLQIEHATLQRNRARETEEFLIQIRLMREQSESLHEQHAAHETVLQQYQSKIMEKEKEIIQSREAPDGPRKSEDIETLALLQREFADQTRYIKGLETKIRKLEAQIEDLQSYSKSISILEEEKRSLEIKTQMIDGLREHISNLELQKAILEEEKTAWTSFLQDESNDIDFSSPAHLARAYVQEKIEKRSLLEKFGRLNPVNDPKEKEIEEILSTKAILEEEVRNLKQSIRKDSRDRQRLERQRDLAQKEANFLREQLKTYSTEESVMMEGNYDNQNSQRIKELEALLAEHKQELESLTKQLEDKDSKSKPVLAEVNAGRNSISEAGQHFSQKIRVLQDELDKTHAAHNLVLVEVNALKKQLSAAETTSKMRILQLKDNPASRHEATKAETLQTLRKENSALLAQLECQSTGSKVVPISTLERLRSDFKEMEALVGEKEKRMLRLKEMWAKKALEFRQAVYSLLGYEVDFQPNGRVKVTSMFHRPDFYGGIDTGIIFDGEQGTMKLCGGPNSQFAREIKNQLKFYVEERKEIPCFLAALTMEGYEKTTRAQR